VSGEPPERDPLADLVSRSIGARVPSVEAEELPAPEGVERKRLRFTTSSGASSAIFERVPRGETIEAQLLPFLARKTDRVPSVHARGLPPPHASLGPWILMEDVYAGTPACDSDPLEILKAMSSVLNAVAKDVPALRALGLRDAMKDVPSALAALPPALVHGDLTCANSLVVDRGVVIVGWRHAFIGPAVLDVAALALDLEQHGREAARDDIREAVGDAQLFEEARRFLLRAPR
jgi:phosphotransferase family enzyme